ncbi:MAG: Gfo/Idh/MocA family oxidoreductase [Alphaproteobacteria bacterium]|nr:Gfo/Idh/MocA family oxidoreductase [Alphaproteobacteria bacterium]
MTKLLRFGVAGVGYWADIVHMPGLKQQPAVELVGAWGRNPQALAEVTARHGIRAFSRFEDMLGEVEAVSISLPPAVQVELAIAAADAGRHLLLEKPIAPTVEGGERVAAAIERNRVANVVFFTRRYVPEFERALQDAKQQSWTGVRIRQLTGAMLPGSPYVASVWRAEENGALWDLAPHTFSVINAILGPVKKISASRSADRVTRFAAIHRGGARSEAELSLHTPDSGVASEYLFKAPGREYSLPLPTFPRPQALAAAAGELAVNIARGETQHRCDVRLGLEVVRALAAADRSIAAGGAYVAV